MTTAARPTFDPAKGGQGRGEKDLSAISKQYSSRDLPSHTKLKYRYLHFFKFNIKLNKLPIQYILNLSFGNYREHGQGTIDELRNRDFRKQLEEREQEVKNKEQIRRPAIELPKEVPAAKRSKVDQVPAASLDADDPLDDDDSDSNSDDDDDTEALMAELQHIRNERAVEQARKV